MLPYECRKLAFGLGLAGDQIKQFSKIMMALYRLWAWLMGDYHFLGNLLRVEAVIFLLLALAFVWLRPPKRDSRPAGEPGAAVAAG